MRARRWPARLLAATLLAIPSIAHAQLFDNHVHLWEGEKSLLEYEAQLKAAGITEAGFGGMWFGGPNLALAGHPDQIRAANDANLALARKYPEMLPMATVHPYDGQAAVDEVSRVASSATRYSSSTRTARYSTSPTRACLRSLSAPARSGWSS